MQAGCTTDTCPRRGSLLSFRKTTACSKEPTWILKEILREIAEYQQLYAMEEQHTPSWKDPTTSQNNFNLTKKEKQIHLQTRVIYLPLK